ncbi:MAG: GNAT family N-acetyltransferase [Actinomycetota bacterium]|nr:GNAT family N-acetyltransferase [Actinomycetota bacterium]
MPRWIEVRSLLLHDEATVVGDPSGGVVVGDDGFTVGVVGLPDAGVLDRARTLFAPDAELLVVPEALEHVTGLLTEGRPRRAILHRLHEPITEVSIADVEIAEVDERFISSMPPDLAPEVEGAYVAAFRSEGGVVVSVCGAASITETLWDVGIDTLEGHRRRGHARACFLALAGHLAADGLQPVWGAYDDNEESLGMARSLGFHAVDELWVIELYSSAN